jgi:purine-binding chemotaxis protein CheW
MSAVAEVAEQAQYLTFFLAGEEYAIGILQVKEILEYDTLTKVPQTPPSIRGVINLRGSVVPVVDLAAKFGLPPSPVTKRTCIVIVEVDLEGQRTVMGVLADAVSQVMDLTPADIEAPPAFGTAVRVDYLQGMGKVGKKFVLILDVNKVLSAPELLAAEAVTVTLPEAAACPQSEDGPSPEKDAKRS